MVRAHTFVSGLAGWRRWFPCLCMGAMAAGALPPLYAVPVLLISFPVLLWSIDASPRLRDALLCGWWFGFGHFVIGFYWLANAFLVDAARFGWLIPFAVLGLPMIVAVYTAIASAIYWRLQVRGVGGIIIFALSWTAMEWLRGHLFTGFPWNLIGYGWAFSDQFIQFAAIFGAYGLSFITVVVAGLPALFGSTSNPRGQFVPQLVGLVVLATIWGHGYWRLETTRTGAPSDVVVRVVQANVSQADKWRADRRENNFNRYLELSQGAEGKLPHAIIWPETAVPYFLSREVGRRGAIGDLLDGEGFVITGAPRISPRSQATTQIWNSVIAIDHTGAVAGAYDKSHLVPFGEYLPLRRLLGRLGLEKLVVGSIDYSAGSGPVTLHLGNLPPVGPLICYEAIFPGAVVDPDDRPAWLLNVSNDGWYGISAGPHQHFAMARLRSVEEGLPLVRAANTGISGVIDSFGRVVAKINLGKAGFIDVVLPQPIDEETIYSRYRDLTLALLALIMVAIVLLLGVMTRTARHV